MDEYEKLVFQGVFSNAQPTGGNSVIGASLQTPMSHQRQQQQQQQQQHAESDQTFSFGSQHFSNYANNNNGTGAAVNSSRSATGALLSEYTVEQAKRDAKVLTEHLEAFGFPGLRDVFDGNVESVRTNLSVVWSLLEYIQRQVESAKEQNSRLTQLQNENVRQVTMYEREQQRARNADAALATVSQKLKNIERVQKEEKERAQSEIKDLQNAYSKIQCREGQFQNEIRKRELTIKGLQDQLRKYQVDKNSANVKNSFEIVGRLEAFGPNITPAAAGTATTISGNSHLQMPIVNSEHEFSQMIARTYDEVHARLVQELNLVKDAMQNLHREIGEMLAVRKEVYIRRKKIETGGSSEAQQQIEDAEELNLLPFKRELFNMPEPITKEAIELLNENVRRFRDFMDRLDALQGPMDTEVSAAHCTAADGTRAAGGGGGASDILAGNELDKIKAIKNLRGLLANYKQVIQNQDELLNRAIVKSNEFSLPIGGAEQLANSSARLSRILDDRELESVKNFVHEQKRYIEDKHKELETTKKVMGATVKKLEEDKQLILERKREMEQETEQFKENLMSMLNGARSVLEEGASTSSSAMRGSPERMEIIK